MRYKSTIKAYIDKKKLIECFKAEEQREENRSSLDIQEKEDHILFKITAKDATALRATLTNITKLLSVFEKAKDLT